MKYFVEAEAPGRVPLRFSLPEAVVRLGTATDAELPLEGVALGAYHLSIEARSDGVWLCAFGEADFGFISEGTEKREALVPWGAEVFVGGARLSFLAEVEQKRSTSPWLLLALGGALVLLGWQGGEARASSQDETAVEAPSFVMAASVCTEQEPAQAHTAAEREELAARSKQERYPFDRSEGLKAVEKYQLAAACWAVAGEGGSSERVKSARDAFEQQLRADYADLRLRLQMELAQGRLRAARRTVEALDAVVAPLGKTPYRAWLGSLGRSLDARLSPH